MVVPFPLGWPRRSPRLGNHITWPWRIRRPAGSYQPESRRPIPGGNTPRAFWRGRGEGPSGAAGQQPMGPCQLSDKGWLGDCLTGPPSPRSWLNQAAVYCNGSHGHDRRALTDSRGISFHRIHAWVFHKDSSDCLQRSPLRTASVHANITATSNGESSMEHTRISCFVRRWDSNCCEMMLETRVIQANSL